MALHNKIGLGLLAGIVVGVAVNLWEALGPLRQFVLWIEPIGPAWIRLIMMIVIPLVMAIG